VKIHCSILAEDAIKAAIGRLPQEVRRRHPVREQGGRLMAVQLTDRAAEHVKR